MKQYSYHKCFVCNNIMICRNDLYSNNTRIIHKQCMKKHKKNKTNGLYDKPIITKIKQEPNSHIDEIYMHYEELTNSMYRTIQTNKYIAGGSI